MNEKIIWGILLSVLLIILLFFNRKVRLFALLRAQVKVFKNDKKQKISLWDCFCFLIIPLLIAVIVVFGLDFIIDEELSSLLTTVFSIFFTVLFGFAAILMSKMESDNKTEKLVVNETFISIATSNLFSLFGAILSIVQTKINLLVISKIISLLIVYVSITVVMLLLLIMKRLFYLYNEQ